MCNRKASVQTQQQKFKLTQNGQKQDSNFFRKGLIFMERMSRNTQSSISNYLKDPASSISHLIGTVMAVFAAFPLIAKANHVGGLKAGSSMLVFCVSLILLYLASTLYHGVISTDRIERRLKKFDHMMVYALIAGTYTPVCTLVLGGKPGYTMLAAVWGIALVGMIINAIWIYCPKWLNSLVYIAMGWVVVFAFRSVVAALNPTGFGWLLAGGIIYTVGGIIYALKLPLFNDRHQNFGTHEIFHIFCIAGSMCHYILMYLYVL